MELDAGNCAPVELEGGAGGVNLHGRAVHAAKNIELIVPKVDRHRVVVLKRRPLRPEGGGADEQQQQQHRTWPPRRPFHSNSFIEHKQIRHQVKAASGNAESTGERTSREALLSLMPPPNAWLLFHMNSH